MTTIYEIADYFLVESPISLTNRELQKLLYFAQGFYLAKYNEALFDEDFCAWKHGPVHSGIFHEYKLYGYQCIRRPDSKALTKSSAQILGFISSFLVAFSSIGQKNLIEYSHADIPWAAKYIPDQNIRITKSDLKEYFSKFSSFEEYIRISNEKIAFHDLIAARLNYLKDLPKIGCEWSSGNAEAPSPDISDVARKFLSGFERYLFSSAAIPKIPRLVMGPIPEGGISLEFHTNNAAYFNFYNHGELEIEREREGYFSEKKVSFDEINEDLTEIYQMVIE